MPVELHGALSDCRQVDRFRSDFVFAECLCLHLVWRFVGSWSDAENVGFSRGMEQIPIIPDMLALSLL